MKYLITGAAGFIGYHTAKRLLENNNEIIGIDNINDSVSYTHLTLPTNREV